MVSAKFFIVFAAVLTQSLAYASVKSSNSRPAKPHGSESSSGSSVLQRRNWNNNLTKHSNQFHPDGHAAPHEHVDKNLVAHKDGAQFAHEILHHTRHDTGIAHTADANHPLNKAHEAARKAAHMSDHNQALRHLSAAHGAAYEHHMAEHKKGNGQGNHHLKLANKALANKKMVDAARYMLPGPHRNNDKATDELNAARFVRQYPHDNNENVV